MDKGIEDHCISMAALGRCFELGDFYNYRNDQIIKDYSEGKFNYVIRQFKICTGNREVVLISEYV